MNTSSERLGAAIAALVIGGVFFIEALGLNFSQNYSDFIVGSLAWYAGNKFQDLVAWPVFIFLAFLAFCFLSGVTSRLQQRHGTEVSSDFTAQLVLWSLPFYAGIGALFLDGTTDKEMALTSALGIFSLGLIGHFAKNKPEKPEPTYWSAVLFLFLLISLIPVEVAVLLSKLPLNMVGDLKAIPFFKTSEILVVVGFAFSVYTLSRLNKPGKNAPKLFLLAQIGLPLFFLTLYPAKFLQPSGEIASYGTTIYLPIFIAILIAYGIYDVVNRFRASSENTNWKALLSPFALFGLVVALKIGHTGVPYLSGDDYHFGEHLLGWFTYLKGYLPYIDYEPAHGLLENDFRSFLSYIFYDGTAASVGEAGRLAIVILGLLAFIAIRYFTGSLVLALAISLLLGGRMAWFFFVPFICLWLSPRLRARPAQWLAIWIPTAVVVILAVPPQGLLLVAAFALLAVKIAWDQIRFGDKKSWQLLGLIAIFLLLALAITPLLPMLIGAIRYVLENGPINQIAYGIPWALSSTSDDKTGFVFEAIRMSWVAIPMLCLYVIFTRGRNFADSKSIFYPALVFLAFSLLLVPYSMGRIDPGGISRPGLASIFGWAVLFPLLTWGLYAKVQARAFVVMAVVFMSAVLGFGTASLSGLASIAEQKIPTLQLRDSAESGLPNIGRAYMEANQWNRINRLKGLLDSRLTADETYLDLTSRNAHYFYLNRAPAMPVTAPYNLVPPGQQKRAIEKLTASPPKLALLQADNIVHDGGGLALRNPHLYRFAMEHYVPRMERGFIVGYLKTEATQTDDTTIIAEIRDITDENWLHGIGRHDAAIVLTDPVLASMLQPGDRIRFAGEEPRVIDRVWAEGAAIWLTGGRIDLASTAPSNSVDAIVSPGVYKDYVASLFQRAFAVSDLRKIPISWGRSEKSLRGKMTSPVHLDRVSPTMSQLSRIDGVYKVEGDDPRLIFDISSLGITGSGSGLLKFKFECIGQTSEPRIQIFWWGDDHDGPIEQSSLKFNAENGYLIVPLDASPWWVGLRHVKGIRLDLDNVPACRAFEVKNISLYQRG